MTLSIMIDSKNISWVTLYQDYNSKFPDQGGNELLDGWYGTTPEFGDKKCARGFQQMKQMN